MKCQAPICDKVGAIFLSFLGLYDPSQKNSGFEK